MEEGNVLIKDEDKSGMCQIRKGLEKKKRKW